MLLDGGTRFLVESPVLLRGGQSVEVEGEESVEVGPVLLPFDQGGQEGRTEDVGVVEIHLRQGLQSIDALGRRDGDAGPAQPSDEIDDSLSHF